VNAAALVKIELDPQGETVKVSLTGHLGPAFPAFRAACIAVGARYVPEEKCNRLPLGGLPQLLQELDKGGVGAAVDAAVASRLAEEAGEAQRLLAEGRERLRASEARLEGKGNILRPYQRSGVEWLAPRRRALLADDMGLGKTVQALVALPDGSATLVVVPACAVGVWRRIAADWRPDLRVVVTAGREGFRWPDAGELVVVTLGSLPRPEDAVGMAPTGVVLVLDEAHQLKSRQSLRRRSVEGLRMQVLAARGRVWLVTGTPLLNRAGELESILRLGGLFEEAFGTKDQFARLMDVRRGPDCEPSPEVADRLRRVMLRRRKVEVLPELPPKVREDHLVQVDRATVEACDEVVAAIGGIEALDGLKPGMPDFERISAVRALLAAAKTPAVLEIADEHDESGEPLVVMADHLVPVRALAGREGWAVVTGETPAEERSRAEADFQAGKLRGIAGTIGALGVAVTLTRARRLVLASTAWTPGINTQAEDRICRIGQDRGTLITRIVADHALDRRMTEILTQKQRLLDATIEASAVEAGYVGDAVGDQLAKAAEDAARRVQDLTQLAARQAEDQRESVLRGVETDGREVQVVGFRRGPATAAEDWVRDAILRLAGMDPDGARVLNGVGFNRLDTNIGRSLAEQMRDGKLWSSKQWEVAGKIARRYPAQVGRPS